MKIAIAISKLKLKTHQIKKLDLYMQELSHFNQKFALVSACSSAGVLALLDSLVAGQLLLKKAQPGPIADIGSGAGFPGLVLAILDPDREFYLYEVHKKKASFLEHTAWKLNLKNIYVKNIPIQEEKTPLYQAVSKAFFSLSKRLELTKLVFKEGGYYYHLQSLAYKKEWDNSPPHLKHYWSLVSAEKYSHPLLSNRILLTTTRLSQ